MPSLKKLLSKFSQEERGVLLPLVEKVLSGNWQSLDIKKLKGFSDVYRVRRGKLRIVYQLHSKKVLILTIERRSDKTYKNF